MPLESDTTELSAAHVAREAAERRIRRLTDNPRELAAQLVGELARRGIGATVCEVGTAPWLRVGLRDDPSRSVLIDEEPGMNLSGIGHWQPYNHDRALAHLMGE